jgi:hypothetical protein
MGEREEKMISFSWSEGFTNVEIQVTTSTNGMMDKDRHTWNDATFNKGTMKCKRKRIKEMKKMTQIRKQKIEQRKEQKSKR